MFEFFAGRWANSQFEAYQLHQFQIYYRSVLIPGQPVFDRGVQAEAEANLTFMGGENIRIYKALLDRATTDRVFREQLDRVRSMLKQQYHSGLISSTQYQELIAVNNKVWNPLDAIRANTLWELKRRNDDRGIIQVKTIGDGRVNLVRYELTLGSIGV